MWPRGTEETASRLTLLYCSCWGHSVTHGRPTCSYAYSSLGYYVCWWLLAYRHWVLITDHIPAGVYLSAGCGCIRSRRAFHMSLINPRHGWSSVHNRTLVGGLFPFDPRILSSLVIGGPTVPYIFPISHRRFMSSFTMTICLRKKEESGNTFPTRRSSKSKADLS